MSPFGGLLADLRRRPPKWTQEHLEERSGVSVSTIRRLETGKPKPIEPRVGTARALAGALADKPGVTPEDCQRLLDTFSETPVLTDDPIDDEPEVAPEPRRERSPAWDALAEVADRFAQTVHDHWLAEEEQRGIQDPVPLPVRWLPAPATLTDRWESIRRVPLGDTADPLDLAGELGDIADVYRRIPSGRLVVLGRAGSGKTVLTLRFVLDYLRTRAGDDPVPVIFSVGSWNPETSTLRDWLIDRLLRDYPDFPGLTAAAPGGSTLAAALVNAGRILPILDGFDEIAPNLHGAALEALNRTEMPLLLTSRHGEFADAVTATGVLNRAAAVELVDLTTTDLANYLARATGTGWEPVLERLDGSNLAEALSTPLMVVLARTVYRGQDAAVLLDTARFPTSEAIENHLLASFVPAVYRHQPRRRSWDPDRVQHWLGYLAVHVNQHDDRDGQDLAWWRLSDSVGRGYRILAVVLACALVAAVSNWLAVTPMYLFTDVANFGFAGWLLDGLLIGPVVGLAFGLVYGLMIVFGGLVFEPSRVRVRLLGRRSRTGYRLVRTAVSRFAAGVLGGFVVGLGYSSARVLEQTLLGVKWQVSREVVIKATLIDTLVFGIIFGLAAGIVFALLAVLETPLDTNSAASPLGLLTTNRTAVLRQVLVLVPMIALALPFGGALVVDLLQSSLGPLYWPLSAAMIIGVVGGLSGALSYALGFTAWGQWVVLSRVWLPLTGRLPWATIAFLDDAYHRGVLRQAGAVYQFRHARLKDQLSRAQTGTNPAILRP